MNIPNPDDYYDGEAGRLARDRAIEAYNADLDSIESERANRAEADSRTTLDHYTPQELIAAAVNNCGAEGVIEELARVFDDHAQRLEAGIPRAIYAQTADRLRHVASVFVNLSCSEMTREEQIEEALKRR